MAHSTGLTFLAPSSGPAAQPVSLKVVGAELSALGAAPQPRGGATKAVAAVAVAAAAVLAVRRSRDVRRGRRVARRFADEDRCGILPDVEPDLAAGNYIGLKGTWEPSGTTLDPAIAKRLAPASQVAASDAGRKIAALGVRLNAELANGRLKLVSSYAESPSERGVAAGVGAGRFAGARGAATKSAPSSRRALVARAAAAKEEEKKEKAETEEDFFYGDVAGRGDPFNRKAPVDRKGRPPVEEDFPFDGVEGEKFDVTQQIGAMAPLGFFDPAGFAKDCSVEKFRNLRASEIKHGRVAMMASVGSVIEHYVKIPGFEKAGTTFESKFNAIVSVPGCFLFPVFLISMFFLELSVWAQDEDLEPGNFGDPLGFNMYDKEMREREINNGRMAMFAAAGIVSAQIATGKDAVQQLGLGL